jgi:stage V sporulation protein G
MEITQVKIFPVHEDKLKAFVSIVFDHCFMVNDIKVIQGKDGLFLSMPSRRKKSGEFKDVAHPLNNETRRLLEERVLREYRLEVDDPTPRRPDREGADAEVEEAQGTRAADESPALRGAGAPPPGAGRAHEGPAPVAGVASPVAAAAEKSLEEVQEMHLSDSFWSVS